LGTMLKQHGAQVSSAASAKDAFSLFCEKLPDVVISDIGMPDEDGYELMQKIRALSEKAGGLTPAIALTGYATRKDRERSLASGYQLHIGKPIEQNELVLALSSLIANKK